VDGECGRHPPDAIEDPWQARDAIRQLVVLGYSETSPAEEAQLAAAAAGHDLHRAFAHFEARNLDEAIAALRRVIAATPGNLQAILLLASSLLAKGELQECRALAEQVAADPRLAPYAALLLGMLETSAGQTDEALSRFAEAEKQGGTSSYLLGNVAWAHLRAKRLDEASRLFHAVRDLEPDSPLASIGLAIVHAEQGNPAESADEALNAIGRRYFWPEAHTQLGMALVRLGQIDRAIQAFETSLAQRPTALSHEWLAMIHERVTRDTTKATTHRRLALAIRGGARQ
jgi:tetratricopeptide (TPR) repeat protein